jgi:ActR/RegA family two-component response regulator
MRASRWRVPAKEPIMSCHQRSILVVESEVSPFVLRLQVALEQRGAETLVARDQQTALQRSEQFTFSAALVNVEHRALVPRLGIPALLYVRTETPREIVDGLEKLLAA